MGFWGPRPFENDIAADFSYDLESSSDWLIIEQVLGEAAGSSRPSDIDEDCMAYAACEVVAMAIGHPTQDYSWTHAARAFVARMPTPTSELVALAQATIDLICCDGSNLFELWDETDATAWSRAVSEVADALRSVPGGSLASPAQ